MNARTDLKAARRAVSAKGEGDGGPRHYLGIAVQERALCRAAHALTAVPAPRASSQAAPLHTSTAIEKPRWDGAFPGMSQESLPTLTAISEVITNGA